MSKALLTRTFADGTSAIRCDVLDSGNVRFEIIAGETAGLSAQVLCELADMAEGKTKP